MTCQIVDIYASLLMSLSKIFEKLMYTRIFQHLIDNNILVDEQFCLRINFSTVQATHKLLNAILNAINNKKIVGSIFCDLHKVLLC